MDITKGIGTDVATICFFHPADLAGHVDDPMTWYATSFAVAPEFERGRLIAFSTGSDGGFNVRITDEGVSDRERQYAGASCEFRLAVEHGALVIDNTDGLPSVEQQHDCMERASAWFDVPNGHYRVTVTAIDWASEPGAIDDSGRATDDALRSFVMTLVPVDDLDSVQFPPGLPDLRPGDTEPRFGLDFADEPWLEDLAVPTPAPLPLLITTQALPTSGHSIEIPVTDEVKERLKWAELVIANDPIPGTMAVMAKNTGASKSGDEPWRISMRASGPVQLASVANGLPLPECVVGPLGVPRVPIPADLRSQLLDAFADYLRADERKGAEFEIARIKMIESDRALTNAIIGQLRLEAAWTVRLLGENDQERAETLLRLLGPAAPT